MRKTKSAGGVVLNQNGEIVVVHQLSSQTWPLPKDYILPGEDTISAARREITEETGLTDLELLAEFEPYDRHPMVAPGKYNQAVLKRLYFFLFYTRQTNLEPIDKANPEAIWLSLDQAIIKLSHSHDQQFLAKHRLAI